MSNTEIIIFSKNRTLQLKSLLCSIRYYSDISDSEITVLYTSQPDIPYEPLISQFGCDFVRQESFFDDLRGIVENSERRYISFMVDDLLIRDSFSLRRLERFLDENQDVDCFSLRMGKHIQDSNQPVFSVRDGDILIWDTSGQLRGRVWNYFWDIGTSIYRRGHVLEYLSKCNRRKISYPNPFESHYYACMPSYLPATRHPVKRLVRRVKCWQPAKVGHFETREIRDRERAW